MFFQKLNQISNICFLQLLQIIIILTINYAWSELVIDASNPSNPNDVTTASNPNDNVTTTTSPAFSSWTQVIQMPNATTDVEDKYLCVDWKISYTSDYYITGFKSKPDNPNVHHMILFACSGSMHDSSTAFDCTVYCKKEKIFFAWARNAPPTNLPKDVGFKLSKGDVNYLRLQVHYRTIVDKKDQTSMELTITNKPQPYTAGVMLMLRGSLSIPAHTKQTIANVSCEYKSDVILYPFAFRVHAHMLGRVISAYVKHNDSWTMIAKGNPQWPHAFWPILNKDLIIQKGDFLASKCVYNSENYNVSVRIGSTHNDEMCNFYMMYYRKASGAAIWNDCFGDEFPEISKTVPEEAIIELPPNPDLEDVGEGIKHQHHQGNTNMTMMVEVNTFLNPIPNWPNMSNGVRFGEAAGLATDRYGFIYVFHRGDMMWSNDSFLHNVYQHQKSPPIQNYTIFKINISTGEVVKMFGKNSFYMPHGIFVNTDRSFWFTDVAMHQVIKYSPDFEDNPEIKPLVILGEKFVPGSDSSHFCKPSDVVTLLTGEVYISDGYCNSRIIVFDRFGNYIRGWSISDDNNVFHLPHSLSIDITSGSVFVAGRLRSKLFVYSLMGELKKTVKLEEFEPELFSLTYSPFLGQLFCLNGYLGQNKKSYEVHIVEVDVDTGMVLKKFILPELDPGITSPHNIALSFDGKYIFVSELGNPSQVLKFDYSSSNSTDINHKSVKKGGILSYHRHLIDKAENNSDLQHSFFDDPVKKNIAAVFIVILCFLVLPLSILVIVVLYLKRKRKNQYAYSHLETSYQANKRIKTGNKPAGMVKKVQNMDLIKEEELKRLESDSEEEFSIPELRQNQL